MRIRKALITSAGFGTRFLPITKTIQKEMLPVLNRPLVDFIVEDCVTAGIEEIVFVVSDHNTQLRHFYSENKRLYQYLKKMNKLALYDEVAQLHTQVRFTFIKQPENELYGTATPVKIAKEHLQDEDAFLVFMGDDFIFNTRQHSEAKAMIDLFLASQASGLATCLEKEPELLHKYGIAETRKKFGYTFLTNLVEKPAPGTAPSNLANISKYIFTPEIFEIIEQQAPDAKSGELYITDSITLLAQHKPVVIYTPQGEYLDGGYPLGLLKANLTVASQDPAYRKELAEYCQQLFITPK